MRYVIGDKIVFTKNYGGFKEGEQARIMGIVTGYDVVSDERTLRIPYTREEKFEASTRLVDTEVRQMKYKVGDWVQIRKDLNVEDYKDCRITVTSKMTYYRGTKTRIMTVIKEADSYLLDIDGGDYYWTDEMLEDVETDIKAKETDATDKTIRPDYYKFHGYDVFDIADYFGLSFPLGNAIKYILRHKDESKRLEDLRKARQSLDRAIELMEGKDNV